MRDIEDTSGVGYHVRESLGHLRGYC